MEIQDLVSKMIVIKPKDRFNIDQVLSSPAFAMFRKENSLEKMQRSKNIFKSADPFGEYNISDNKRRQLNPKIIDLQHLNFAKKKNINKNQLSQSKKRPPTIIDLKPKLEQQLNAHKKEGLRFQSSHNSLELDKSQKKVKAKYKLIETKDSDTSSISSIEWKE